MILQWDTCVFGKAMEFFFVFLLVVCVLSMGLIINLVLLNDLKYQNGFSQATGLYNFWQS